ncbi:AhpC/TSA antioxidant enzyme-domain-containing protein [Pavlovales sp. CCMP2436]|nr:AhpC/TSA antioxidant enzyme-domain-containing protein [Pavlovales sp. CCMP2436]|mmetsp:Transcript_12682/g.32113  ORF Transcript_12682/g.32113 Transcript_12682/m.32113 type:complete len:143 (-) Transcript_12682:271-699(-)
MRDIKPLLDEAGVKLIAVGIGTPERGQEFCEHIGFPRENLYSDPTSACYTAIGLYKGVGVTFFSPSTPFAILDRLKKDGGKDLFDVLQNWKPWLPPEQDQAFQQGGTFVFAGPQVVFQHYDKSTGDHADLRLVLDSAIPKRV